MTAIGAIGMASRSRMCSARRAKRCTRGSAIHRLCRLGESVTQLGARVAAWLMQVQSAPGHVVAVTHPFVVRAALMQVVQGAAFNAIDVEPLASIELQFNGRWRLRLPGIDPEGVL